MTVTVMYINEMDVCHKNLIIVELITLSSNKDYLKVVNDKGTTMTINLEHVIYWTQKD